MLQRSAYRRFAAASRLAVSRRQSSAAADGQQSPAADAAASSASPFDDACSKRADQSRRSILIDFIAARPAARFMQLLNDNVNFENTTSIVDSTDKLALVEFPSVDELNGFLERCCSQPTKPGTINLMNCRRIVRYRDAANTGQLTHYPLEERRRQLDVALMRKVTAAPDLNAEIETICAMTQQSEFVLRARFFLASTLEQHLRGVMAPLTVHPFGSSVNGFGSDCSDVDLLIKFAGPPVAAAANLPLEQSVKQLDLSARGILQLHLLHVRDLLREYMPDVRHVVDVTLARVPILRIIHNTLHLEADLKFCDQNETSLNMSKLLWTCVHLDERVRPLVFAVRHWSRLIGVGVDDSGSCFTKFKITILVIFYLQNCTPSPVLPPLNKLLVGGVTPSDTLNMVDALELQQMASETAQANESDVASLLKGFFNFYAQFKFLGKSVSLLHGNVAADSCATTAATVLNPLDETHNMFNNVVQDVLRKLRIACRDAASVDDFRLSSLGEPSSMSTNNIAELCFGRAGTEIVIGRDAAGDEVVDDAVFSRVSVRSAGINSAIATALPHARRSS